MATVDELQVRQIIREFTEEAMLQRMYGPIDLLKCKNEWDEILDQICGERK